MWQSWLGRMLLLFIPRNQRLYLPIDTQSPCLLSNEAISMYPYFLGYFSSSVPSNRWTRDSENILLFKVYTFPIDIQSLVIRKLIISKYLNEKHWVFFRVINCQRILVVPVEMNITLEYVTVENIMTQTVHKYISQYYDTRA